MCEGRSHDDDPDLESSQHIRPLLKLRMRGSTFSIGTKEYDTNFPPLLRKLSLRSTCVIFSLGVVVALFTTVFKEWFEQQGLSTYVLLSYVSIPIVSVLFTYFHIWMALWLTFYPIKYVGCLQIPETNTGCGWQGIMPNKAEKMARMSVRLMTEKLIQVDDIVARIDANQIVEELDPVMESQIETMIDELAANSSPQLWRSAPEKVKKKIISDTKADSPLVIKQFVEELQENIADVFDLEELVVHAFVQEPALLNHMFISCGYTELGFIRDCGAYMGGAFGIVQVIIWTFYPAGWMLPTFGFVAGLFTNWAALKMIFSPIEPVYVGGIKFHGLFLRRQLEVSEVYAQIVADNVLNARNILRELISGRLSEELQRMLQKHIDASTDRVYPKSLRMVTPTKAINNTKLEAADKILCNMPSTARHVEKYLDTAMALEVLLCEKLSSLRSADFEKLLHPVFQEDEWKLILMGGVLGIAIGCLQWKFLGA